jgi:hypothetical protein
MQMEMVNSDQQQEHLGIGILQTLCDNSIVIAIEKLWTCINLMWTT